MPVLCIRSHAGPLPSPRLRGGQSLTSARLEDGDEVLRRKWQVSIRVDDWAPVLAAITDPFTEEEYKMVFEEYLRSSRAGAGDGDGSSEFARREARIRAYGEDLLGQLLGLGPGMLGGEEKGETVQIDVVEYYHDGDGRAGGVHCLAWELLESVRVPWMPTLRLRITRVGDFPLRTHPPPPPSSPTLCTPPSLSATQRDPNGTLRILLVVARDFSKTGPERDPEPDLAQWPLMSVQRRLRRGRMLLEVVRPGSLEALEHHLRVRAAVGVGFHLVHFDLHGRIMRDENGDQVPWLLFAKRRASCSCSSGYHVPGTHLAKAQSVAALLSHYRIENVVLNACLSAYNHSVPSTNLAHVFLEGGGVKNISAMWFYVHWRTAATYLDAFYGELLERGEEFHVAAQKGREAVRRRPTERGGVVVGDFFVCVNYARSSSTGGWRGGRSPAPSTHERDSSTSEISPRRKGFMSRMAGRQRLLFFTAESLLHNDEPIMRMKLHLLELEYELVTFRTVYASDMRGGRGSDLEGTIGRMVDMWLATNWIDEVRYYEARDFAARRRRKGEVPVRERRTRYPHRHPQDDLPALWQTLHVIRGVDPVVDPGYQVDDLASRRSARRRILAQTALERFAWRMRGGGGGGGYLLILGSQDMQWWGRHLRRVGGGWWVHVPWHLRVSGRH